MAFLCLLLGHLYGSSKKFLPEMRISGVASGSALEISAAQHRRVKFINPHFGLVIFLSLFVFLRLRDYFFDRFYERDPRAIHSQYFVIAVLIAYFIADFR